MKTCSYNDAQPRLIDDHHHSEGIFCRLPPQTRYSFLPCEHEQCPYCSSSALKCESSNSYRFLNGYQVILNCSAVSIN